MTFPGGLGGNRLSRVSRYTARFHIPAAGLEGLVAGVFTLNDIVLRKTFGASAFLVTLMVAAPPVSQLLAIVWGNLMEGRSKRPFILGFGGIGRLALLLVAVATTPLGFSLPVVFSITMATAIVPALNALYQTNYTNMDRGQVFGWVMSVTAVCNIAGSMGAGAWMDLDPRAYRWIYPLAGVVGLGASILYYRIRARRLALTLRVSRRARAAGHEPRADRLAAAADWLGDVQRALRHPLRGALTTFRADPDFLRFEAAYMVYGLAWMLVQPVIPIFLVDEIRIEYGQAALARGLVFWGVISLASPLFGRMLDRWNAVRVSIVGFALLIFFPLAMALSRSLPAIYASFAIYGLAMAAVNISWTMGPMLFAGNRDAAVYMGVHVTMVGIRGLVGNPLGLLLLETAGSRAAFLTASALFAGATILMLRLQRRMAGAG